MAPGPSPRRGPQRAAESQLLALGGLDAQKGASSGPTIAWRVHQLELVLPWGGCRDAGSPSIYCSLWWRGEQYLMLEPEAAMESRVTQASADSCSVLRLLWRNGRCPLLEESLP